MVSRMNLAVSFAILVGIISSPNVHSFLTPQHSSRALPSQISSDSFMPLITRSFLWQSMSDQSDGNDLTSRISAKPKEDKSLVISSTDIAKLKDNQLETAKTNTVNERLLVELQAAADAEKGSKTAFGEKFKGAFKYSDKSEEERALAIEEARDLNGVNPTITILASFFAFGMAYGFWWLTGFLGALFISHPLSDDAPYAFTRIAAVVRNAVIGLSSLASGFSFVSGLGVFLLGVRVAYGEYIIILSLILFA